MRRAIRFVLALSGIVAYLTAQAQPARWERGLASWYGAPYDGQKSASGEIYYQDELTAAHRTLPFGALVRVHRLDEPRSVVVRINDRGPLIEPRIIDLSYAAALRLGMARRGLAPVALEIVARPLRDPAKAFSVDLESCRGLLLNRSQDRIAVTVRSRHVAPDVSAAGE